MFDTFHIDILSKEDLDDMKKEDYIVTVDSQKYNTNLTDLSGMRWHVLTIIRQ